MPLYESTFITRQDISEQEVKKLTDSFVKLIEGFKGKVIRKEFWGLRQLSYIIKKNQKGYYFVLYIDTPSEAIDELTRKCKLNENIIRNLTIKIDDIPKEASELSVDTKNKRKEG